MRRVLAVVLLLVYISPTGEKFHSREECGSM